MNKPKFEIGQEIWKINSDLTLEQKKIVGYKINSEKDKINYELDVKYCQGISETEVFKTKKKAEVRKQDFLDELNYKVGDLIVFEYKDYNKKKKTIGRIIKIVYSGCPYEVRGSYKEFSNVSDEKVYLKIKNQFIEDYSNLQELYEEFKEKEKEINEVLREIHKQHEFLEGELGSSIKKEYSILHWNKSKPLFEDRFDYKNEVYYD